MAVSRRMNGMGIGMFAMTPKFWWRVSSKDVRERKRPAL